VAPFLLKFSDQNIVGISQKNINITIVLIAIINIIIINNIIIAVILPSHSRSSSRQVPKGSKGFDDGALYSVKAVFVDFVHRLYFNKITFRKLDLLPSSGKKEGQKP
jgi:hypothetical protein